MIEVVLFWIWISILGVSVQCKEVCSTTRDYEYYCETGTWCCGSKCCYYSHHGGSGSSYSSSSSSSSGLSGGAIAGIVFGSIAGLGLLLYLCSAIAKCCSKNSNSQRSPVVNPTRPPATVPSSHPAILNQTDTSTRYPALGNPSGSPVVIPTTRREMV